MSRRPWGPRWAKQASKGVEAKPGYNLLGWGDYVAKVKSKPNLRTRWSEKAAVTKRAQTQKVSLARIPSLEGTIEDHGHGRRIAEADIQARPEVPRQPR